MTTENRRADALTDAQRKSLLSHADEMDAYGWKDDAEAIRLLLAAPLPRSPQQRRSTNPLRHGSTIRSRQLTGNSQDMESRNSPSHAPHTVMTSSRPSHFIGAYPHPRRRASGRRG